MMKREFKDINEAIMTATGMTSEEVQAFRERIGREMIERLVAGDIAGYQARFKESMRELEQMALAKGHRIIFLNEKEAAEMDVGEGGIGFRVPRGGDPQ